MINDNIIACVKFNSLKKLLPLVIFNIFLRAQYTTRITLYILWEFNFQEFFLIKKNPTIR
jgi:hypothetical protein